MTQKILLVGKEKSIFNPIKAAFENQDIDIIVATSIGLALFLARKNSPALIISQQELTDSSAHNFYLELKSEDELSNIPFVLLVCPKDGDAKKQIPQGSSETQIESLVLSEADCLAIEYPQLRERIYAFMKNSL